MFSTLTTLICKLLFFLKKSKQPSFEFIYIYMNLKEQPQITWSHVCMLTYYIYVYEIH